MNIPYRSALVGILLLFCLLPSSDARSADVEPAKEKPQTPPAAPPEQTGLGELRTKREKAQAELDAVNQPKTFAAGAPPGTPQEELLERRTLLHHIVRSLDEQIDDTLRLEQARRRRTDAGSPAAPEAGAPGGETPHFHCALPSRVCNRS
jgi:hypothetical protein